MLFRSMRDNARDFTSRTGQQPQIGDFYGMHQQGPTGWTNIVNNPNGLAYKSVGFQQVLQNLPGNMKAQAKSLTNAQFRDFINNKVFEKMAGPDGQGYNVLFGGATGAPSAPPPMIPSGTAGGVPIGDFGVSYASNPSYNPSSSGYSGSSSSSGYYAPSSSSGVNSSGSHSVSHTGGGGSYTPSHGSGSVSFAPVESDRKSTRLNSSH